MLLRLPVRQEIVGSIPRSAVFQGIAQSGRVHGLGPCDEGSNPSTLIQVNVTGDLNTVGIVK